MQIRALVVDDSRTKRRIVKKGLKYARLAKFEVTEAVDGLDALAKFSPTDFDIVFVDWYMPEMDGLSFVQQIRRNTANDHVKLVMVTTNTDEEAIHQAMNKMGADAYICEPFTPEDMREQLEPLIEQIIERRKKQTGILGRIFLQ